MIIGEVVNVVGGLGCHRGELDVGDGDVGIFEGETHSSDPADSKGRWCSSQCVFAAAAL